MGFFIAQDLPAVLLRVGWQPAMSHLSRRDVLRALAACAVAPWASPFAIAATPDASQAPRFEADPFSLGVASGYPAANGIVLWTRLAPAPDAPGGGMGPATVAVRWEIAGDGNFSRIVASGTQYASAEWAHSIHVEVGGLLPARQYWYRFTCGDASSPAGRFRTAPGASARPGRLRLALASCQQYEQGYYAAHRHLAADDPDLVLFVGDYIYESSWGREHVRKHRSPESVTLEDYRARYALYKSDPDLQAAHAAAPWAITWDDHEVSNDYANQRSEGNDDPAWFLARRAGAYKAWYEHMPVPRRMVPFGPYARIYSRLAWGNLASINLLDDRQYRTPQACPRTGRGGSNVVDSASCKALAAADRTLLGERQLAWLEAGLSASRSQWNLLAQQSIMAQVDRRPGPGREAWTDAWDGYPAERRRLLELIADSKTPNPVVLGGDVHMFYVNDLKTDFDDPKAPVVASEFVGTSISSQAGPQEAVNRLLPENPQIRFANSEHRGYTLLTLTPERLRVDLRALEAVRLRDTGCSTLASFIVENGSPGAKRL